LILTGNDDLSPSKVTTLPPLKPPRNANDTPTKEPKVDEWEAKLYGKSLDHGHSTDSLKRRSWESSRVPLNLEENVKELEPTIEEQSMDRISLTSNSPTAQVSPVATRKIDVIQPKPRVLPRSNTAAEPIVNLDVDTGKFPNMSPISLKNEKPEKLEKADKHDNIFSKKWKNFKKELTPVKQDEQIRNQYNKTSSVGNGGERIIIGGESLFNSHSFVEKKVEVSKEILAKYDGKSKEVSLVGMLNLVI
jgi:hypothetical protein